MNTKLSVTSGNAPSTSTSVNQSETHSEGKLGSYSVTSRDSVYSVIQGLAVAATARRSSIDELIETREVTILAGANAIEKNQDIVPEILFHMHKLKTILKENDEHYKHPEPSPCIEIFTKAIKLLSTLELGVISKGDEINDGCDLHGYNDGSSDTYYDVYYKGELLFTVTQTESETRYRENRTSGDSGKIETTELFDQLYLEKDVQ